MNYREMECFVALSRHLNFSKTAEECHLTTSAVSRLLQRLEEETGRELVSRYTGQTVLTEEGLIFARFCRESLERYEELKAQWRDSRERLRGRIRLFCSVTAAYSLAPKIIHEFQSRNPEVEFVLVTGAVDEALDLVQNEEVDLALAVAPPKLPGAITAVTLQTTPVKLIAPVEPLFPLEYPEFPLDRDNAVPWILPEKGIGYKHLQNWFRRLGLKPKAAVRTAGNEGTLAMVSMGFGIGAVSMLVLQNSPLKDKVRIIPVPPESEPEPYRVILAGKKTRIGQPLPAAFWSSVQKTADTFLQN